MLKTLTVAAAVACCLAAAPAGASLIGNSLLTNSLIGNALTHNSLIGNALTPAGSQLNELNGVAVEAVSLPNEPAR